MTQDAGTTALFVIDAFRYEMGDELYRALADTPATTVHLKSRLAELPTDTPVGMNALAPVASNGRLSVVSTSSGGIAGFSTGEMRVTDPESRKRAMFHRVGGHACPLLTLEDVVSPRRRIAEGGRGSISPRGGAQSGNRQRRGKGRGAGRLRPCHAEAARRLATAA